jgi:hypothetical protein
MSGRKTTPRETIQSMTDHRLIAAAIALKGNDKVIQQHRKGVMSVRTGVIYADVVSPRTKAIEAEVRKRGLQDQIETPYKVPIIL